MSRREDIDTAIWTDPDFEELSPRATLLYLWSFTNLRCGMAGIYKVSRRAMTESKLSPDAIEPTLAELSQAGFAFYEDNVLWVRTRVKHIRSKSPQMAKAIANDLLKLPADHPLREQFLAEYGGHSWLRDALKGVSSEGIGTVSENPTDPGNSHNPSGTSREVPGKRQGMGEGKGHSEKAREKAKAKTRELELATSEPPANFPDELRPHLTEVHTVLSSLAERHGAKAVSMLSLGTMMAAPTRRHKPFVSSAYDFASWADGKAQRRKDVIAGYRDWLGKKDDLAGLERVTPKDDGNVVQLKSRFNIYDEAAGL